MSELTETLREEFKDKETRHVYSDEFLNSSIATQIKVLREQRGLTQRELAERAGMRQERISVLEDVNYSSWTINVLRRLAEAFDLTLTVKFESFGEKLFAIEDMSRETLEKPAFDEDPIFQERPAISTVVDFRRFIMPQSQYWRTLANVPLMTTSIPAKIVNAISVEPFRVSLQVEPAVNEELENAVEEAMPALPISQMPFADYTRQVIG